MLLQTKELLNAADIGKLRLLWDGPRCCVRGGAADQPPPGAQSHALPAPVPGAPAGPHIRRRRVAARGGAGSLPRGGRRAGRRDAPPLPLVPAPPQPSPRRPPPPAAPPLVGASAGFRLTPPGVPPRWRRAPPYWAGRCCAAGLGRPAMAGFVGRWFGVVGPRGSRT